MPAPDPLVEKVETLQNMLISTATGGGGEHGYEDLRRELLSNPLTKGGLPRFVHTCRSLSQFWQFIKYKYGTYAERPNTFGPNFGPFSMRSSLGRIHRFNPPTNRSFLS